MSDERRYEEVIGYLYGLQRLGIKFGLENITRVLEAIGSPHERLPAIHIAGSNGKGSTAAHLESVLMYSGFRVGLYSSPHFVRFNERIRINREPITQEDVVSLTEEIIRALPELSVATTRDAPIPVTFFEMTTAIALAYFVQKEVDMGILEVGMGGRLDATNVCHPVLSIITTISLEHREFLGQTVVEIAREKGGIIKTEVPVILGVSYHRAKSELEMIAKEKGAPVHRLGKEFKVKGVPENFDYKGLNRSYRGLQTSMRGRHQIRNAGLALAASELLDEAGFGIREESIRKGLKDVRWRGRQEWHPGPPQILLDGAHNPEAMRMLCRSLKHEYDFDRLRVLMGVMKEKDHSRMIRALGPLTHEFVFCRSLMERSQDPWVLQAEAERLGFRATVVGSVMEGFKDLLKRAMKEDLVCVTGSLFVVGEILACLEKNHLHLNHFLS